MKLVPGIVDRDRGRRWPDMIMGGVFAAILGMICPFFVAVIVATWYANLDTD